MGSQSRRQTPDHLHPGFIRRAHPSKEFVRSTTVTSTALNDFAPDFLELFEPFDWKAMEAEAQYENRI